MPHHEVHVQIGPAQEHASHRHVEDPGHIGVKGHDGGPGHHGLGHGVVVHGGADGQSQRVVGIARHFERVVEANHPGSFLVHSDVIVSDVTAQRQVQ